MSSSQSQTHKFAFRVWQIVSRLSARSLPEWTTIFVRLAMLELLDTDHSLANAMLKRSLDVTSITCKKFIQRENETIKLNRNAIRRGGIYRIVDHPQIKDPMRVRAVFLFLSSYAVCRLIDLRQPIFC